MKPYKIKRWDDTIFSIAAKADCIGMAKMLVARFEGQRAVLPGFVDVRLAQRTYAATILAQPTFERIHWVNVEDEERYSRESTPSTPEIEAQREWARVFGPVDRDKFYLW